MGTVVIAIYFDPEKGHIRGDIMKIIWKSLLLISAISFILFISLFVRGKNMQIKQMEELTNQSLSFSKSSPPLESPPSMSNQNTKQHYEEGNGGTSYELGAVVSLGVLIISGILVSITATKK